MTYTCCLCGRKTAPFAFIGSMAVGPKCFKRMNIKKPRASVAIVKQKRAKQLDNQMELELEQTNRP